MGNPTWIDDSDDWTTSGDWSTGAVPGAGDDVAIAQSAPEITSAVPIVHSVTVTSAELDISGGALTTTGDLTNMGTSDDFSDTFSYVNVDSVYGQGGSTVAIGGALTNGVNASFVIGNDALAAATTVKAAAVSNVGSISVSGSSTEQALLDVGSAAGFGTTGAVTGEVAISGDAEVRFASGSIGTIASGGALSLYGSMASIGIAGGGVNSALGSLATIDGELDVGGGAAFTSTQTAVLSTSGTIYLGGYDSAADVTFAGLTNAGSVTVEAAGGITSELQIGGSASNTGSISISGGDGSTSLIAIGGAATNMGTIALHSNSGVAELTVGSTFDNAGKLLLDGGTSYPNGGGFSSDDGGSVLQVGGTLTNEAGGTFDFGNVVYGGGEPPTVATTATIGALSNAGSIGIQGGTTTQTSLDVSSAAGFGTTGVLTGTIALYDDAKIQFQSGGIESIAEGGSLGLYGADASIAVAGGGVNSGLLPLSEVDGTFAIDDGAGLSTGALTVGAIGQLMVGTDAGGDTLDVGGTLTNAGDLMIGGGNGSPATIIAQGLANQQGDGVGGSIFIGGYNSTSAASLLQVDAPAGFGTTGVLTGTVSLQGNGEIQFASGSITSIAPGALLELYGPDASIADAGQGANSALSSLAMIGGSDGYQVGSLDIEDGVTLTTGALDDEGLLSVGTSSSDGAAPPATSLTVDGPVTGNGSVDVVGKGAVLDVEAPAGLGGTPGVITDGVMLEAYGAIQFASGSITRIGKGGDLQFFGPGGSIADSGQGSNSALALATIDQGGELDILSYGTFSTPGALTNNGTINLDLDTSGGTTFAVNGTLTNSGTIQTSEPYGAGLSVPDTITANGLVNTGGIVLFGAAPTAPVTVSITGDANATNGLTDIEAYATLQATGTYTQTAGETDVAGTLAAKALMLGADTTFDEALDGTTPGSLGVTNVTGSVSLGGATLGVFLGYDFTPSVGQSYTIINNEGSSPVSGTFAGLAQGATFEDYYDQELFTISYSGGDGNDVVVTDEGPVCFAAGTRIRTVRGDVAVETLAVGDLVVTLSGNRRPIRWLGHRRVDCRTHPCPQQVMPVHIEAHAFGANRPVVDIHVSPAHAICVDILGEEMLVPASSLLNGTTITQIDVDEVSYWHVELDSHDIVLADGLPAESYLDVGNRTFFVESGLVALDAVPDGPIIQTTADFCRPFHVDGPLVEAVRERLATQAASLGWRLDATPTTVCHLLVDGALIDPIWRGLVARFSVPAGARDICLVSDTTRPCDVGAGSDVRPLGACLKGLVIEDGFCAARSIALADHRLRDGFYDVEDNVRRWTGGRAPLPASLWEDCPDGFFLRVELATSGVPRWHRTAQATRPETLQSDRPDAAAAA